MIGSDKNTTPSAGYPRIENLVDSEKFDGINKSFAEAFNELEKIAKQKAGLAKAKQAKKVMKAYELTMALLKELLQVKYQLIQEGQKKR